MKNKKQKGINIIEITIVLAILGIILAVVVPGFSNIKKTQVLKNASQQILLNLKKAQAQTLASLDLSEYGVFFEEDRIVLFKGTSYSSNDLNNQEFELTSPAIISNISLDDNNSEIYFNKQNGNPNTFGIIEVAISSDLSLNKTISISNTGAINLN